MGGVHRENGMGDMPDLQKQNTDEDPAGHGAKKLPAVLSQMQTGNTN